MAKKLEGTEFQRQQLTQEDGVESCDAVGVATDLQIEHGSLDGDIGKDESENVA